MYTFWIPTLIWWSPLMHLVLMQTVNWELKTSQPKCYEPIQLHCTVTNYACCTSLTRTWTKIVSGVSTNILNNGATNFPGKYIEQVDTNNSGFSLFINDVDEKDVDIDYICGYGTTFQANLNISLTCAARKPDECPMQYDTVNKKIVGTLYLEKLAPLPSMAASFGGENYTGYLIPPTPTPVSGYPKFYTINSSLNKEGKCFDKGCPRFTLSVTTGSSRIHICDDYDICKCKICGGINYGWSVCGIVIDDIFLVIGFCACCVLCCLIVRHKYKESKFEAYTIKEKCGAVFMVLIFSAIYSFPIAYCIGYFIVNCHDGTSPSFIACGVVIGFIYSIIVLYLMSAGKDVWFIFLCLLTWGLYLLCKPDDKDSRYISFCVLTCGLYLLCKKQGSKSGNGKTYEPTRRDSPCHNLEDMN